MLKSLRRIIHELENISDLTELLNVLAKRIREALETEACIVFLLDQSSNEYVLAASEGLVEEKAFGLRVPFGKGLVGYIGDHEKPLNIENAQDSPYYYKVDMGEEKYRAVLGVPIIYERQLLGVLMVEQQEPRKFAEEEESFLVTLATQVAPVVARAEVKEIIAEQLAPQTEDDTVLLGIPSGGGIGIGQTVVIYPAADFDAVHEKAITDIDEEITLLKQALELTRLEITILSERMADSLPQAEQEVFTVYLRLLDSHSLENEIINLIKENEWAQGALKQVIQKRVHQFESMDDPYLRERAADIRDLGQRILAHIQTQESKVLEYPEKTILIGDALSATDLARVPEGCLVGIASATGSANSHVAILARALKIPAVMGVTNLPCSQLDGKELIIDGYYGHVYITPTSILREEFLVLAQAEKNFETDLQALEELPAETTDGYRVALMVNAGLDADASAAMISGASGVGLFRTEITFMKRERFPTEEEQRVIYRQVLKAFSPRAVTMRTLDIGGDKTLPYFPIEEENPFLGWRGIRISLDRPEIFQAQIRAMLRANRGLANLKILLPMISTLRELDEAQALITAAYNEVNQEEPTPKAPVGVMIEVPSAVYQARHLARRSDFLSVGSNDLTQYLLAVDRNNAKVSGIYDAYHPAVLQALDLTVKAAKAEGKPISICGELAGDPVVTILLVAMGFDMLSANAGNLPRIKWVIRHFGFSRMQSILTTALTYDDPQDVRVYMEAVLTQAGLGALVRAGR